MKTWKYNKYQKTSDTIEELIGKDFGVEIILKSKNIATKIKFYENEIKSDLHDEGLPLD